MESKSSSILKPCLLKQVNEQIGTFVSELFLSKLGTHSDTKRNNLSNQHLLPLYHQD